MTRNRKARARSDRPTFQPLPIKAFNLRRRAGAASAEVLVALGRAVEEARALGFASLFDSMEKVLRIAEPWVDRDVLRAHILADEDPSADTKFALAFVRGDGDLIDPKRWYVLPPATVGEVPVRIVVIAVTSDDHRLLVQSGYEEFFTTILTRLANGREP